MFCVHCGKQLADGFTFCPHCGGKVVQIPETSNGAGAAAQPTATPTQPVNPVQTTPNAAPAAVQYKVPQRPVAPPRPAAPPVNAVAIKKEIFRKEWRMFVSSPLVLVAIICFTAVQVISFFTMADAFSQLGEVSNLLDLAFDGLGSKIESSMTTIQLLIMTPAVLTVIGLWMTYSDAYDQSARPIKTTGLKIIHVLYAIVLVLICIAAVVGLFSLLGLMGEINDNKQMQSIKPMVDGILWGFLIGIGCSIAMAALEVCVLKNAVDCAELCATDTSYLTALSVILYISSGLSVLGLFSAGVTFTNIISVASTVLFAVVITKYKECLETIYYRQKKALSTPKPGIHQ